MSLLNSFVLSETAGSCSLRSRELGELRDVLICRRLLVENHGAFGIKSVTSGLARQLLLQD